MKKHSGYFAGYFAGRCRVMPESVGGGLFPPFSPLWGRTSEKNPYLCGGEEASGFSFLDLSIYRKKSAIL